MTLSEILNFNKKNVCSRSSLRGYGMSHFALRNFKAGEVVVKGYGKKIDHQTSHYSIQISQKKHILPNKWTGKLWNHSCKPNTYLHSQLNGFPELIASRKIKEGEEITYSYWMSEYSWHAEADEAKINCKCGEKQCFKKILSFTDLPKTLKNRISRTKRCSSYLIKSLSC